MIKTLLSSTFPLLKHFHIFFHPLKQSYFKQFPNRFHLVKKNNINLKTNKNMAFIHKHNCSIVHCHDTLEVIIS